MELSNLFTVEVCIWEKIIQKFPNIKKGIIVDEVCIYLYSLFLLDFGSFGDLMFVKYVLSFYISGCLM